MKSALATAAAIRAGETTALAECEAAIARIEAGEVPSTRLWSAILIVRAKRRACLMRADRSIQRSARFTACR